MDLDQELQLIELCALGNRADLAPLLILLEVDPARARKALCRFIELTEPRNVATADSD